MSGQSGIFLFAIYDKVHKNNRVFDPIVHDKQSFSVSPIFHFRFNPPIQFSPDGSPLLIVSVIDHQLARQLIAEEKLENEQNQSNFTAS